MCYNREAMKIKSEGKTMLIERTLENGIRLVGEKNDTLHSVTVGFWVRTGQRNERDDEMGVSHFIEHMLFKGTSRRSARDISVTIDEIGGQINAFTAKEYTCFYARCMDSDLELVLDVLTDMLQDPKFDSEEMKREKGVVIEEINMVEDTPEDLVHDLVSEAYFGAHPLARPILGTRESVSAMTEDGIRAYMRRRYHAKNVVVALAGNFDADAVERKLNEMTRDWPYDGAGKEAVDPAFDPAPRHRTIARPTEQLHICLGFGGVCQDSPDRYGMMVFNNIFGGGMSSRLFQEIRESRGLAYSVYSYPTQYVDCGTFTVYGGMTLQQADAVGDIVRAQIDDVLRGGIEESELVRSRSQLRGNYILGSESSSNRMMAIGRSYLMTGEVKSAEQVLSSIANVTMDDVMAAAKICFAAPPALAAIGPKDGVEKAAAAFLKE